MSSRPNYKAQVCFRCNRLSEHGATCKSCRHATSLSGITVASYYEGAVKELIGRLKYYRASRAAAPLAAMMTPLLVGRWDFVTSVPPDAVRFRQRGQDHAAALAQKVAHDLGLPYQPSLWRRKRFQQVGNDRKTRMAQAEGSFGSRGKIETKRILIVDDVTTTGATLAACAGELKAAGASHIWAVVAAKH